VKVISSALKLHKAGPSTTLCKLMRMERTDGLVLGFTDLDVNVTYDDGDGPVDYDASQGMLPSTIAMQGALSVENAEVVGLLANLDTGINPEDVRAGLYDYAKLRIYQVNYEDLTMGHEWLGAGSLGECTIQDGRVISEYRGLAQPLKQNVCELYSITCRAQYGDAKCGKSFVWVEGEVTAQGTDPTTQFVTDLAEADNFYVPGAIQFLTGKNAGRTLEVIGFASATVSLLLPLYYPPLVGDAFRIRIDCNKHLGTSGCQDPRRWGADFWAHFRGEPLIPIADGKAVQVPGASQ
jgi:uncharacterized phage protein (TIGR02218 family)